MKNEERFLQLIEVAVNDPTVEARRKAGFEKYDNLFKISNIDNMDIEKFRKFFNLSENQHWHGLTQNITLLTSNPKNLKESLKLLLDESKPISERIDKIIYASRESKVKGFGLARISAILHYAYPDKYGAYNIVSLKGLSIIGENPKDLDSNWQSLKKGEQYNLVNEKLVELCTTYHISLWAIDWVWWDLVNNLSGAIIDGDENEATIENEGSEETRSGNNKEGSSYRFALEKHLEDFLIENWEHTSLYKDLQLDILKDEDTGQSIGVQYRLLNNKVIDILCKNKKTGGFTVIELKRGGTSTNVLGQIKVYMGWIKKNFANGKPVDGIIIAQEYNEDIKYALIDEKDLKLLTFKISFELNHEKIDL